MNEKGNLSIVLVVTRNSLESAFPINPSQFLTKKGGQVKGASGAAVQKILRSHGIDRILAKEGGRTSRGSIDAMKSYVVILNDIHRQGLIDFKAIEDFWVERVREYFSRKPLKIRLDVSKSLKLVVRDILEQARKRQQAGSGMQYTGAVLQHLVGAKLDCALGMGKIVHNSSSTSDEQLGRHGDFDIGDVAIHVTTAPSEALMKRCNDNLNQGIRPCIITLRNRLQAAEELAEQNQILDRIDAFEIEQFIALNMYELGKFQLEGRKTAIADLVRRYNEIVEANETDLSLRIEVKS